MEVGFSSRKQKVKLVMTLRCLTEIAQDSEARKEGNKCWTRNNLPRISECIKK